MNLCYIFNKTTAISIFLLLILFPVGLSIPNWVCFENQLIDNLQVVVLFWGCLLTIYFYYHESSFAFKSLWINSSSIFLLMILRELSWGCVFYPLGSDEFGPYFISLDELWYGSLVHPILAIVIPIILFRLIKDVKLFYKNKRLIHIAIVDFIIFASMALASQLIFEKGIIDVLKPYAQNLEECSELIAYWALVSMIIRVYLQRKTVVAHIQS